MQRFVRRFAHFTSPVASSTHRISASSVRLLGLIESLLEYAHIETGRLVVQRERVDVPALVQEVVSEMAPQAAEKGLELRVAPAGPLPAVESDPRLIRLIVANLVGNAIKFTMRGAVDLSCSHQGDVHRLSVRDSGPGIPPTSTRTSSSHSSSSSRCIKSTRRASGSGSRW